MRPATPRPLKVVQDEANNSDVKSQKELGDRIGFGLIDSLPHDWEQAKGWYEKAAAQDYPPAQYALGLLYYHGRSVQQDFVQAALRFTKAANQGDAKAQYMMGIACYYGRGVVQSFVRAAGWYQKAPTLAEAQNSLGGMYERGEGVAQDFVEAAKRYSSLSYPRLVRGYRLIEVGAYYNLRKMYEGGRGVSRETLQATEKEFASVVKDYNQLQKIMKQNSGAASDTVSGQFLQGLSLEYGIGCPQDILGAIRAFSIAAVQDFIPAMCKLGEIYSFGQDVGGLYDYSLQASWYRKAASLGDAHAQFKLADAYKYGRGVPPDKIERLIWLEKAANQGHIYSQYLLALNYRGHRKDPVKAVYWLTKAANLGQVDAQFTLASDLADGKGGERDCEALSWFEKAAAQGHSLSQMNVERLRKALPR